MKLRFRIIFALPAVACAIGCAPKPQEQPEHIDRATWESPHTGFVQRNQPVLVAQGALPLVYQMQQNGTVRVMDATTGTQLAATILRSMDIIRITTRGVVAGESQFAGPLPADHRYTIYLQPAPEPVMEKSEAQTRPAQ